jgi:hypothetical protein
MGTIIGRFHARLIGADAEIGVSKILAISPLRKESNREEANIAN